MCYCTSRDSARLTVSVRAEIVLVHNKTCTRYCSRNRETLTGELLGLVQINNLG